MILQDTKILITVQIVDNRRSILLIFALATGLFDAIGRAVQTVERAALVVENELKLWAEALELAGKALAVGFNALAFGVGWG